MKVTVVPGRRRGEITVPLSKSHLHRLLIARFLSGDRSVCEPDVSDNADIVATRRCLRALGDSSPNPELDCGESGSTLRFMAPLAAALGKRPKFVRHGRLADRPMLEYPELKAGVYELPGNVSSQFVTGLLFALPLVDGVSRIRLSSPLESRGYVDMTLSVLADFGITVTELDDGFEVCGKQHYTAPKSVEPEGDWSAAAFWYAANALGSRIAVRGLSGASRQPDRVVDSLLPSLSCEVDVSACPDLLPALTVVAAGMEQTTVFKNAARLRIKESDRIAAMQTVLGRFGVRTDSTADEMRVYGRRLPFSACEIDSFGDHRIAMAAAVAATAADGPVVINGAECVAKSYPAFWDDFNALKAVAGAQ